MKNIVLLTVSLIGAIFDTVWPLAAITLYQSLSMKICKNGTVSYITASSIVPLTHSHHLEYWSHLVLL